MWCVRKYVSSSNIGMSSSDQLPSSIFLKHITATDEMDSPEPMVTYVNSGTEFTELVFLVNAKCNSDTTGLSSGCLDEHFTSFPRATQ